jgi:hypothetical protein
MEVDTGFKTYDLILKEKLQLEDIMHDSIHENIYEGGGVKNSLLFLPLYFVGI